VDLALGPAVACLLAGLATGRPAPLLRLLDARPLRKLGASSYSLYLTHGPIVVVVYERVVAGRVRQGVPAFLVTLALVLPLTIGFARVFAAVFETGFRLRPRARWVPSTSRTVWAWARIVGPAVTFPVLVWRLGTGPFLDGVRTVDGRALTAAAGIAVLTTVCCAWRWKLVARGLGVDLSLPAAVAAYYRSQFLNLTLPGGIVGDVHRGVSHGRDVSDVGRGLRAVAYERAAGQVVQIVLTVAVLLALPSAVRSSMPLVAAALVVALAGLALAVRRRPERSWSPLLARRAWLGIALASAVVVGGHAATFLIAARTAGVTAPVSQMLPLALLVMGAAVLPSVGGWGPREGATAWVFGAAGLGAGHGVATAVVYGVMVLFASLPGAAVLLVAWFRRTRAPWRSSPPLSDRTVHA
jgi:uncharacterized membrane protein YbhN (UPF0104 family)